VGTAEAAAIQVQVLNLDPRRSLVITDQPILERFPLQRVLAQIIDSSGVCDLTPTALFQQWWDTQNPGPGLDAAAPHCDDAVDSDGYATLNGYPYACRPAPAEGGQASCDPFAESSPCAYIPIGLFMRFDAAPEDGSNCGEYRIVYAKETGRTAVFDRNLVIFEASMSNPLPGQGLAGCKKLVRSWGKLSKEADIEERADRLERIYFDGENGFDPVVHWRSFGHNAFGLGQVRTNQFVQPGTGKAWSLREFKIAKQCAGADCTLRFVPVTNKGNPFGPMFSDACGYSTAPAFRTELLTKVEQLAAGELTALGFRTSDAFNSAQSVASMSGETNFLSAFGAGPSTLRDGIQTKLTELGSTLTPDDIVKRAQAMSCAGCHRLSNNQVLGGGLTWPASLGFTHLSERDVDLEVAGGVTRYRISAALEDVLLPHRKQVVESYLNSVANPIKPGKKPIGGSLPH